MLDQNGYRPCVGIILLNQDNKVFWAKRIRRSGWQFPQGGIRNKETPLEAMYRELKEEIGLNEDHVSMIARTKCWLHYDVPEDMRKPKRNDRWANFKGQKQIWFLLRMLDQDYHINLKSTSLPEFDDWRWADYWSVSSEVIGFKQNVYEKALTELSSHLSIMSKERKKANL